MIKYTVKVYDDGTKFWFLNGKLHREDDPAIEWANGSKSWWLYGKQLTEEEFNARNKQLEFEGKPKIECTP